MPGPPPMKNAAAMMLVTKKPIATGTPSIISPRAVPNSSVATQYQAISLFAGHRRSGRDVGQRGEEVLAPPEEARELDRHHEEGQRDEADDHPAREDRKSTRLNSSHSQISYAVFCLKKKKADAIAVRHIDF